MSTPVPTVAGWYPDPATGGTRYSDGSRWTGDTRPRRRTFAAAATHRGWGIGLIIFGVLSVLSSPGQFSQPEGTSSMSPVGAFFSSILLGVAVAAFGVYLIRGQGPTTKAVEERLAARRNAADAIERKVASTRQGPQAGLGDLTVNVAAPMQTDAAAVAQINALANPETAKALQNLQNLLYTQAISEEEYQAAKDRLLGAASAPAQTDAFARVTRLAELHQAGILSDYEFAAAKARALGI